jgi:hypothetical protein
MALLFTLLSYLLIYRRANFPTKNRAGPQMALPSSFRVIYLFMHVPTDGYPELVRADDLIGQLGDPNRLLRCLALFYEFQEIGLNEKLGYKTPGDLRQSNAKFYCDVARPYIQAATRYLRVTHEGKRCVANLYENLLAGVDRNKAGLS